MKRLVKKQEGAVIFGICNGIADYLNVDPTIVRLIWAAMILFAGTGVFAYLAAAVIIPDRIDD